ncbi:MAG: serine/threonine protein kinase [Alphaproteobacteria bacterium]|nr:serine/threonine protein kinase [Alphaproteobacteria bacterium]
MIKQVIDEVEFKLKEYQDFSWLNNYGTVFSVIDETGSGCISFGIKKNDKKYFFKIAGAKTVNAEISEEESIKLLKEAAVKYKDIKHENLIKLVDAFEYKEFYVVIYEYAEGECLFDHWNFDRYEKTKEITPMMKFKLLPVEKRLKVADKLFSFFESFIDAGYVAVDFYDSSIIYDFENDEVTFCDIDLFRKMPTVNDLGKDYFGTKRLKAPEENELGAVIDEQTSLFTLGAIIFDMFSNISNTQERYNKGYFIPNKLAEFELNGNVYNVLLKATAYNRKDRYKTIKEFKDDFRKNIYA